MISLTESQLEAVADCLRECGFDCSDLDNDQLTQIIQAVLDGLDIEFSD